MSIVTIAQAKPHLSIADGETGFDTLVQFYLDASEAHVAKYIRKDLAADYLSGLPSNVTQAILLLTATFFRNREEGDIPISVKALLAPERDFAA